MEIKIQSFIDLITNSSTEVFTQATPKTLEIVKEIINLIFLSRHDDITADDLFTFKLRSSAWQNMCADEMSYSKITLEQFIEENGSEEDYVKRNGDGEACPHIYLEILPKVENEYTSKIAELFNNLYNSYETEEFMC